MEIERQVPSDGIIVRINHSLYDTIRGMRNFNVELRRKVLDSSDPVYRNMIEKKVTSNKTNLTYEITDVIKHWYWGWYYVAVLNQHNGPWRMIYLQNESCDFDIIKHSIRECEKEFNLHKNTQ